MRNKSNNRRQTDVVCTVMAALFAALLVAALVGVLLGAWWHIGTVLVSALLVGALGTENSQAGV